LGAELGSEARLAAIFGAGIKVARAEDLLGSGRDAQAHRRLEATARVLGNDGPPEPLGRDVRLLLRDVPLPREAVEQRERGRLGQGLP
jgi:hypothetical protein